VSDERKTKHKVVIDTTPDLAFEALTQASELREWFCDRAETEVRPSGRYEVRWNQGYRAEGRFTELDTPHGAALTWQGTGEPGETAVVFGIEPVEDAVEVTIIHTGFGPGDEWDQVLTEAEKGWANGLENLKATLETGVDQRLARQPFLGIYLDLLTPERAAEEGIAAEEGVYVAGTVEGSAAEAAGLREGDVLVALGGAETPGYEELGTALRAHSAGDEVELDLVRGQEREMVPVTLGTRPQTAVPDTAPELAQAVADRVQEVDTELKEAVEGLSEEEAEQAPAEGEWSVKEVLAHLSIVERDYQGLVAAMALDGWRDGGQHNLTVIPGRLAAVLTTTPTLEGMVDRFLADEAETVAFLRSLPEETVAHKARFYRIGQTIIGLPDHTQQHIEQIKATIKAVRGEGSE
jgi:uncharacterized protein YndB with AHSA1/START domain/uncharacterized damage-inducible protein DinB